jgi:hypothetical protein
MSGIYTKEVILLGVVVESTSQRRLETSDVRTVLWVIDIVRKRTDTG